MEILKENWQEWLRANRQERMDATIDLFNEKRRAFHSARYEFALDYVGDLIVADIACGLGYGASLLATKASKVYGVDKDEKAIEYAQEFHAKPNTFFMSAFADYVPILNNSLDVLVSFETIEHVDNDKLVLDEFHRMLKRKGKLIISTPNNWGLSKYHKRSYTLESFRNVLLNLFKIEKVYNQNSGSSTTMNRHQPCGVVETTSKNENLAECFIVVCIKE